MEDIDPGDYSRYPADINHLKNAPRGSKRRKRRLVFLAVGFCHEDCGSQDQAFAPMSRSISR
jgi:hypothetical protein